MTPTPALAHFVLAATSKSSSSNPLITLLPLVAIGVLGYFFFIRPQQRKAQAARQSQGSGFEVGDEVQTVGGVVEAGDEIVAVYDDGVGEPSAAALKPLDQRHEHGHWSFFSRSPTCETNRRIYAGDLVRMSSIAE